MTPKKPIQKKVKAWAVVLDSDGFIPDFSFKEIGMEDVLQIHSAKNSAEKLVEKIGGDWTVVSCVITYTIK